MGFYDHFHSSDTSAITGFGRRLVTMRNQYFVDLIKRFCATPEVSALEIGCGGGFFAEQCRRNGISYVAIEANPTIANALMDRGFEVHPGFAPPIALSREFDVIFMDQVFEHMRDRGEAVAMLQSCKDHLRPGGILLICSPDILTVKEDFYSDYTHNTATCMPMLDRIFMDCEFDIVYRNYLIQVVRGLLTTRVLAFLVRVCYGLGCFHIAFGKRAHLAKVSLLPSCVVVGRNPTTNKF